MSHELLHSVAATTTHRDRDELDKAVARLLLQFLDVQSVTLLRVTEDGQIKRLVTTPDGEDVAKTTVHLVRVSRRDIRAGVARMKEEPGVHAVETKAGKARDEG